MITLEKPYFLTNETWYYHDEKDMVFKLTDQAPQDAIDSYNEFYDLLNSSYQST
jgi:hypothetical protein